MELQRKILTSSMSALAVVAVLGVAPLNVQAQQTTHTVEAGEYLYNIAPQYDVTVDELIEWNNLSSNDLQIGDQLIVQSPNEETPEEETSSEITDETTNEEIDTTVDETQTVQPTSENGHYYVVKPGDYLYKIANRFGITTEDLIEANNLVSNNLQIGDVLFIPSDSAEEDDDDSNEETPSETYYTVQAGDYLYKIAQQFGTTIKAIKDANDLTNNNLQIGDVLLIPDGSEEDDEEETPSETYYTVQAGDYLYKIAQQFGTTVEAIKEANGLTNNNLQIGDVLLIPDGSEEDDDDEETPSETYYTVQAGDYLYKIAQQFGTTVEAIKEANDLTNNNLQIGDVLLIPDGSEEDDDDEETPSETYYTVQAGDYLYKIAQQFGTTVEAIKDANDLTNNNLQIGDVLLIPDGSEENDDEEETPSETYYTVQAGDYLYKIAQKFGTTIEAIKDANDLTNNNLQIGDVLLIPDGSDEDPEIPEFIAPEPGDLAYMPGMTLVEKYFPTVNSAVTYAEENFDYNEHENYFVNYFKGSFVLYFQPK